MSNNEYQPVDLGIHPDFSAKILLDKKLIVLPSQGQGAVSKILIGFEGEMLYEHRQEAEAMTNYPGIFISRLSLPKAEEEYRQKLLSLSSLSPLVKTECQIRNHKIIGDFLTLGYLNKYNTGN